MLLVISVLHRLLGLPEKGQGACTATRAELFGYREHQCGEGILDDRIVVRFWRLGVKFISKKTSWLWVKTAVKQNVVEKGLLTPDNCVVALIDHQPQMLFGVGAGTNLAAYDVHIWDRGTRWNRLCASTSARLSVRKKGD